MSVAVWSPPAVLAGLVILLWVTSWLDTLVTPGVLDADAAGEGSDA
jgi:hypothetical protein